MSLNPDPGVLPSFTCPLSALKLRGCINNDHPGSSNSDPLNLNLSLTPPENHTNSDGGHGRPRGSGVGISSTTTVIVSHPTTIISAEPLTKEWTQSVSTLAFDRHNNESLRQPQTQEDQPLVDEGFTTKCLQEFPNENFVKRSRAAGSWVSCFFSINYYTIA